MEYKSWGESVRAQVVGLCETRSVYIFSSGFRFAALTGAQFVSCIVGSGQSQLLFM